MGHVSRAVLRCHSNSRQTGRPLPGHPAVDARAIFECWPAGITAASLSDIQKTRVAEFMSGRPMGSIGAGEAKSMPNRCTANPPMRDPASGPRGTDGGTTSPTLASSLLLRRGSPLLTYPG